MTAELPDGTLKTMLKDNFLPIAGGFTGGFASGLARSGGNLYYAATESALGGLFMSCYSITNEFGIDRGGTHKDPYTGEIYREDKLNDINPKDRLPKEGTSIPGVIPASYDEAYAENIRYNRYGRIDDPNTYDV